MKTSIRFYNDREVRAIWDEEKNQWFFSAVDIVDAIGQPKLLHPHQVRTQPPKEGQVQAQRQKAA